MKNDIVKILEAIDLLDYTFGRVLELHQSMINFLNDVSKTEKGKFIIDELNKILKQKNSQGIAQKDGLIKACGFTGGISVGVKLSDKILEKEDDMKELEKDEVFMKHLKNLDGLVEKLHYYVSRIDTSVDLFFSGYYEINNRKKDNYFWRNYSKELVDISGKPLDDISEYLNCLNVLRRIRNGIEHCNNMVDKKFANDFNINYTDEEYTKFTISLDAVYGFCLSAFMMIKYFGFDIKEYDIKNHVYGKTNLRKLILMYDKLKKEGKI